MPKTHRTEPFQAYCTHCERTLLHHVDVVDVRTNHIVHALITIFSCALWLPVWMLASACENSRRALNGYCSACGNPTMHPEHFEKDFNKKMRRRAALERDQMYREWLYRAGLATGRGAKKLLDWICRPVLFIADWLQSLETYALAMVLSLLVVSAMILLITLNSI